MVGGALTRWLPLSQLREAHGGIERPLPTPVLTESNLAAPPPLHHVAMLEQKDPMMQESPKGCPNDPVIFKETESQDKGIMAQFLS